MGNKNGTEGVFFSRCVTMYRVYADTVCKGIHMFVCDEGGNVNAKNGLGLIGGRVLIGMLDNILNLGLCCNLSLGRLV